MTTLLAIANILTKTAVRTAVATAVAGAAAATGVPTTVAAGAEKEDVMQPQRQGHAKRLTWMSTYLGEKLIIGTRMAENKDTGFYEMLEKTTEWRLSNSHGLTEVILTTKNGRKLKKCLLSKSFEQCGKGRALVFVMNDTIFEMVNSTLHKSKEINMFVIQCSQPLKGSCAKPAIPTVEFHAASFTRCSGEGHAATKHRAA
ncbi:uncharacterized protein [Dermacentor andersoni]|uniref:uncharacterized protein isoform X3 n=1 Tax=Dermacentor andersoni TaxID=34620 RepID=UPI00241607DA|nr:uncharacterized protein LOC129384091 isoform X3 [Dermacentor andersoni]